MRRLAVLMLVGLTVAFPARAFDKPRDWEPPPPESVPNHREQWRMVVTELAAYAKGRKKDFLVVMHGGLDLLVKGKREIAWEELQDPTGKQIEKRLPEGGIFRSTLQVIDGVLVDGLYCGDAALGKPLSVAIKERRERDKEIAREKAQGVERPPVPQQMGPFSIDPDVERRRFQEIRRATERLEYQRRLLYVADALGDEGRRLLSLDFCKDGKETSSAYAGGERDHVLTFASTEPEPLTSLPKGSPHGESAALVMTLKDARNWLPLVRPDHFGSKTAWVEALGRTNHDVVVLDVSYRGADALTKDDVKSLKFKRMGTPRLVFATLPVGRAYDWRWYWKREWKAGDPAFLFALDEGQPGAYLTDVGNTAWREILGKYITGIIDLGFDGVIVDDLDTYTWFEDLMPIER